jgi:ABC-type dipeptide/oligopeptide/nickel transport system permease subunit
LNDPRAFERFRRNRSALFGAFLVVSMTLVGVLGPVFAPHDPAQQFKSELIDARGVPLGPGIVQGHPLGGDSLGRDMLSRLLHGGRVSMLVAYAGTALAVALGVGIGLVTGYFGGPIDTFFMRVVDVLLSMPFLLVAMVLQRQWEGSSLASLVVLLGVLSWTSLARIVRSKTQQLRELDYVTAARAMGATDARILFAHVLPNCIGPILTTTTMLVAGLVLSESSLSFLGFGVRPPQASWGSMLSDSQNALFELPRLFAYPALLILVTIARFNFLGEGLRDALDPKD